MMFFENVLDLIYPPRCVFCHKFLDGSEKVCENCYDSLPYAADPELRNRIPHISGCVAPLYYEKYVRDSLLRYKFNGLKGYAEVYGEIMSKAIDEKRISCDIITWVPLSIKRYRRRGYDQARLLAEEVAMRQGRNCMRFLEKYRNNPAQSGTGSPEKRKANVKDVYRAVNTEYLKGKTVLLIDDIVTTGATLSECAKVLREHGAADVFAAALARSKD